MNIFRTVLKVIFMVLFLVFLGHGLSYSQDSYKHRQLGYRNFQLSMAPYPATEDLYYMVKFCKNITIHFCGSRKFFKEELAKAGAIGYVNIEKLYGEYKYDLYILAKKYNGKIIYNIAWLGHELNHILSHMDSEIRDIHDYEYIDR